MTEILTGRDYAILTALQIQDINGSTTPEEVYKKFCDAVSRALPRVIHNALYTAASAMQSQGALHGGAGWEKYLRSLVVDINWGQPGIRSSPSSLVTCFTGSVVDSVDGNSIEVSVSVGSHF